MMKPLRAIRRWWLWLPLLAAAGWLAIFGDKTPVDLAVTGAAATAQPQASTPSAKKGAVGAKAPAASIPVTLLALIPRSQLIGPRDTKAAATPDLFAGRNWTPVPVPLKAAPPPPPVAPPLPFTFLGKKLEGGVWEVFLARDEQSFVVREGSLIDNSYRVDAIAPPNLSLTYLPLGQSQSLAIGETR